MNYIPELNYTDRLKKEVEGVVWEGRDTLYCSVCKTRNGSCI